MKTDRSVQEEMLEVMDHVLSAALKEVRRARARHVEEGLPGGAGGGPEGEAGKRKSNTQICLELLKEAGRPLHVSALLRGLEARGVRTSRESVVSALSKRFSPVGPFVRTAGNTFGLAGRDSAQE